MAELDTSNLGSLEPNSHKYKAEKAAQNDSAKSGREKLKPIVEKGGVASAKKPIGKKISETFMSEDTKDVKTWLISDVLVPGIKNTILDILSMAFFGEVSDRRRGGSRNERSRYGRTNYSGYYSGSSDRRDRTSSRGRRDRYDSDDVVDFRNIVLRERIDAERVIDDLHDRIAKNGSVSVADLLDLVDLTSRYTDNNWGWEDERDIGIRRVSSGYLIDVAEPKYLD